MPLLAGFCRLWPQFFNLGKKGKSSDAPRTVYVQELNAVEVLPQATRILLNGIHI